MSSVVVAFLYLCKMSDLFRLVSRSLEIGLAMTIVIVPDLFIPRKEHCDIYMSGPQGGEEA